MTEAVITANQDVPEKIPNDYLLPQSMVMIGGIISQGQTTRILDEMEPDYIVASEFMTVRNEQSSGALDNWADMDMVKLVVAAEHAECIFNELYLLAEVAQTEGAYIYMHPLHSCTDYQIPDLPAEGIPTEDLDDWQAVRKLGLSEKEVQGLKRLIESQA